MSALKCVHVVPGIAHEASGTSYIVPRLCEELTKCGIDTELHTGQQLPSDDYQCTVRWHPGDGPFKQRTGFSRSMRLALHKCARTVDVMHNHGLWMMPNVYPAWAVRRTACKLVTSPHGTLTPWALNRSKFRKKLMWWLGQSKVIEKADCLHATSESEYWNFRALGLETPVAVIPNGYDVPRTLPSSNQKERRRVLYLGRIHPIKGLPDLISAWESLGRKTIDWELHLVGPGFVGHVKGVRRAIERVQSGNIVLRDAVFGAEKSQEYVDADLYVLPSHSENFAMTVAEALGHRVPAIVTQGAPWQKLNTQGCGWWVENGPKSLATALEHALELPSEKLRAMGYCGRDWIEREFNWQKVGQQMLQTYQWIVGGGRPPDCMRLD